MAGSAAGILAAGSWNLTTINRPIPMLDPIPAQKVILPCGWGRLIFAHTFPEPQDVAQALLEEEPGKRDIAFYVTDPHILLNTAPRDLFMDPSDTYRLHFPSYKPRRPQKALWAIGKLETEAQINAANRIYRALGMVPMKKEDVLDSLSDDRIDFFVATARGTGEVLGVTIGVDHKLAFDDIMNGSSLWSLAVDPQGTLPGVGAALVCHLVEYYQARGRDQLDLSVLHDNEEAIAFYTKLGFERVPVFAVKRCNPINEKLFTGGGVQGNFNPYAKIIIDEAVRRGISIEPVLPEKGFFNLTLGGRSISCRESLSDMTSAVAMSRCDDKEVTRHLISEAGLSLPEQRRAGNEKENSAFLEQHNSVVVKPARGEQGMGVAVNLRTLEEMENAISAAQEICDSVLIEQFVSGEDLRIIVISYEVVAAAVRKPAEIVGTGRHTIRELIERASRRRAAATGGESQIPIDEETTRCIRSAGFELDDTLETDSVLRVRNTANLHTGGTIHDVTPELHPALATAAIKSAQVLEMPVVGLDFIVRTPSEPNYCFIEANERPGLANHEPQPTAERFIDLLFPHTAKSRPEKSQLK